jgi:hypothetical protein
MEEAGQEAAEALTALIVRFRRYQELQETAARSGFSVNPRLVTLSLQRAIGHELAGAGLADGGLLPPSQRIAVGTLLQNYAARTAEAARAVLGEPDKDAA